jgi:hypothetical protein
VIAFSGADLDRAPAKRRDPGWLSARRSDPRARAVQLSERGVWIKDGRLLLGTSDGSEVFLGLAGETPLFASDVSAAEPRAGHPAGLREAATELPADEAAWRPMRHRCCPGTGGTASVPTAARPPRSSTPGTSGAARCARRTTSRAPTRS